MTTEQKGPVDAEPKASEVSPQKHAASASQEDSLQPDHPAVPQESTASEPDSVPGTEPPKDPGMTSPAVSPPGSVKTVSDSDSGPATADPADSAADDSPETNVSGSEESSPISPSVPEASASAGQPAAARSGADGDTDPARLREKMMQRTDESRAVADSAAAGSDAPAAGGPVDIPKDEVLDASLEAQISEALSAETGEPDQPAGDGSAEDTAVPPAEDIRSGSELTGIVQQIHGDDVFIDAGLRGAVIIPIRQFPQNKPPSPGDRIQAIVDSVDDDGNVRARLPQARHRAGGNWDALKEGQVVDCMVTGTNKGGLQVTVSNLRGFMPASQIDTSYVADLEAFVGKKLTARITEVNRRKRNLVVSRRALLEAERASQQGDFWESLEVGQEHEGIVKTIKDYGAFINMGPMDGFLHIGEMSWSRINHPRDVLTEGQSVQVRILRLDPDRKRISLGMKQLVQNPWHTAAERYAPERVVPGKVTRIADFGAFVELEPGIEGLVHISELAWRRVGSVNEVLSVGDERDFQVIDVDPKRRRVSLSVKALEKRPEPPAQPERQAASEERRPRRNLRGGTGGTEAGGLFGNPSDFS